MCSDRCVAVLLQVVALLLAWLFLPFVVESLYLATERDDPGIVTPDDVSNAYDALFLVTRPFHDLLQLNATFYGLCVGFLYLQTTLSALLWLRLHKLYHTPSLLGRFLALSLLGLILNLCVHVPPSRYRLQTEPRGLQYLWGLSIEHTESILAPRLAWQCVVWDACAQYTGRRVLWGALAGVVIAACLATRWINTPTLLLTLLVAHITMRWHAPKLEVAPLNGDGGTFEIGATRPREDEEDDEDEPSAVSTFARRCQTTPAAPVAVQNSEAE